jgi:hypothetical protein
MSGQSVPKQPAARPGVGRTSAPSPSLPDINAETYPFEVVLHWLDQAEFVPDMIKTIFLFS